MIKCTGHMYYYLLCGMCIRTMLKMGLHRDPSKLQPGIGAYDGEIRRRIWNLVVQIDLLVSFHLDLLSMINGIKSDTAPPRNLLHEDFDESTFEMPPERGAVTDFTHMSYPTYKNSVCKVFGKVTQQAHSLKPPSYAKFMSIDNLLEERWAAIPAVMRRPLDTCITDPPCQVLQRFGIGALYQKARYVLHRRAIGGEGSQPGARALAPHVSARCACAAEYQHALFVATKPGPRLSGHGWLVSSLAMHNLLLGVMVVYLVLQHERCDEPGGDFRWTDKTCLGPASSTHGRHDEVT